MDEELNKLILDCEISVWNVLLSCLNGVIHLKKKFTMQ